MQNSFIGFALVYMMRANLSVAVLDMESQFRWAKYPSDPKGIVLSTFFIGYIFGQVPGGLLATNFGGKHILGAANALEMWFK